MTGLCRICGLERIQYLLRIADRTETDPQASDRCVWRNTNHVRAIVIGGDDAGHQRTMHIANRPRATVRRRVWLG